MLPYNCTKAPLQKSNRAIPVNGVPTQRELILFNCVLQTTADTGGLQSNNSRIRRMHIILLSYIIYLRFSKIHLVDISMHYACIRVLNIILQMQPGNRTVGVCVSICFFNNIQNILGGFSCIANAAGRGESRELCLAVSP